MEGTSLAARTVIGGGLAAQHRRYRVRCGDRGYRHEAQPRRPRRPLFRTAESNPQLASQTPCGSQKAEFGMNVTVRTHSIFSSNRETLQQRNGSGAVLCLRNDQLFC
jgi:hypothetical protein